MGDDGFDSESAKEMAEATAWENKRKKTLKKHGLWEKYGDETEVPE